MTIVVVAVIALVVGVVFGLVFGYDEGYHQGHVAGEDAAARRIRNELGRRGLPVPASARPRDVASCDRRVRRSG